MKGYWLSVLSARIVVAFTTARKDWQCISNGTKSQSLAGLSSMSKSSIKMLVEELVEENCMFAKIMVILSLFDAGIMSEKKLERYLFWHEDNIARKIFRH
jgi:hypothetical protein